MNWCDFNEILLTLILCMWSISCLLILLGYARQWWIDYFDLLVWLERKRRYFM